MAKTRINKRGSRKQLIKIKFLVEGITEKFYFKEFLKNKGYPLKIDIDNISGGGYFSFIREIQKKNKINLNFSE